MKGLLSNLYKKIGAATQEWIAEREADQKRLDYLDADPARLELVMKLAIASSITVRAAVDRVMASEVAAESTE